MIFTWLLHKIKGFFLVFLHLFRRALCCIRKRRSSFCETVPLTHVVSNGDKESDLQTWTNWGDENLNDNKPRTVQDYIEQYRQQMKAKTVEKPEEDPEEQLNLFEDMSPKIIKQTKVLIRTKNMAGGGGLSNRLNVVDDAANIVPSAELAEWDENSGWEGEQLLDREAQKILREQKRLERERKAWEQHQKRLEKASRPLGSKLVT